MNILFPCAVLLAVSLLLFSSPEAVLPTLSSAAEHALSLSLSLVAVYALWMGLSEILKRTGLAKGVAKAFSPLLRFLFGDLGEAEKNSLTMNLSANLLGLGSVATPMGIATAKEMERELLASRGEKRDVERFERKTSALFLLNASMLQLLPTSVISLRLGKGSVAPQDIWLPSVLCGAFSLFLAVLTIRLFLRGKKR